MVVYRKVGCPRCNRTGYKGRIGIFQLLIMNDELESLAAANATRDEIDRAAFAGGMRSLWDDGIAKAAAGLTSVEELARVVSSVGPLTGGVGDRSRLRHLGVVRGGTAHLDRSARPRCWGGAVRRSRAGARHEMRKGAVSRALSDDARDLTSRRARLRRRIDASGP